MLYFSIGFLHLSIFSAKKDPDNQDHLKKYSKLAVEEANDTIISVLPYIPKELKGVWIRPTETSSFQIVSTLNKMQDIGIDNVFLETFYHGKTIFPSKTMEERAEQSTKTAIVDPTFDRERSTGC